MSCGQRWVGGWQGGLGNNDRSVAEVAQGAEGMVRVREERRCESGQIQGLFRSVLFYLSLTQLSMKCPLAVG